MSREGALLVMVAVALVLIGLMAWGWWHRSRRDSTLVAPFADVPEGAAVCASFDGLYVATTAHDAPLERLAVRGLGFRSRGTVAVVDTGVVLDLDGQSRIVIPADLIDDVTQSTVVIDRVVERDGLTRLTWRIAPERVVDSYFRPQNDSARALADAIRTIVAAPTPAPAAQSGTDA